MADRRGPVGRWVEDNCCPVVCTLATAEVERLCAKNNLLFHELLSAFGTVDNLNATIRGINSHHLTFPDFKVRFERATEATAKSAHQANEALATALKTPDVDIPTSLDSFTVKDVAMPLASKLEHCIFRSTTFAEHNTLDAPCLLLIAASSTDFEPLQCLQELQAAHKPRSFRTGMYDPDVPCLFVLVHDSCEVGAPDPMKIFREMQTKFAPLFTRMLMINSMPPESPNTQQPDLWSPNLNALFFPREVPDEAMSSSPTHAEARQSSGESASPVSRGAFLSPEDLMALREFVSDISRAHILPMLERRLLTLNNAVTSARKGVRNALKSWWRKPREETERVGEVLYRYDRIESQIRLLADTLFLCKDYEPALSMYKMVRDDYKADKAFLHYAHTNMMIAICHAMMDTIGRFREIQSSVEAMMQGLVKPQEGGRSPVTNAIQQDGHHVAFMALMGTELLTAVSIGGRTLCAEAAIMCLHGSRYAPPIANAMLTEKAGWYFLRLGQFRRFAFHEVLAARTYQTAGKDAENYAVRCYSVAMLEYEAGQWGNIKAHLNHNLAQRMITLQQPDKALLFLLRLLCTAGEARNSRAATEVLQQLHDLCNREQFGNNVDVLPDWKRLSTKEVLETELSISTATHNVGAGSVAGNGSDILITIPALSIPEVSDDTVEILRTVNGPITLLPGRHDIDDGPMLRLRKLRQIEIQHSGTVTKNSLLALGKAWLKVPAQPVAKASGTSGELEESPPGVEWDLDSSSPSKTERAPTRVFSVGEPIVVRMQLFNTLGVDLELDDLKLRVTVDGQLTADPAVVELEAIHLFMRAGNPCDITLRVTPLRVGHLQIVGLVWKLNGQVRVTHTFEKKGPLLQRTLQQRALHQRAQDTSLQVQVIQEQAQLSLQMEGIYGEALLSGEVYPFRLHFTNHGRAPASQISCKFSQPWIVLSRSTESPATEFLPFTGPSGTICALPAEVTIQPGESHVVEGWLRAEGGAGKHLLFCEATYFSGLRQRECYAKTEFSLLPSLSVSARRQFSTVAANAALMLVEVLSGVQPHLPPRVPSAGQPLLDTESFDSEKENTVEIHSVALIGGSITARSRAEDMDNRSIKAQEKMSLCVPVEFGSEDTGSVYLLQPHSELAEQLNVRDSVLQQFIYLRYEALQFQMLLVRAKLALAEQEREDPRGPRTISEIRRDNQKARAMMEVMDSQFPGGDWEKYAHVPSSEHEIASVEAKSGSATLIVRWQARVRGRDCFGIHIMPNFPLQTADSELARLAPNNSQLSVTRPLRADCVTLAIEHPPILEIEREQKSGELPVTVTLCNRGYRMVSVSIEAVDDMALWKKLVGSTDRSNPQQNGPLCAPGRNFRWTRKTHCDGVVIRPSESVSITFLAQILAPGKYQVNRFRTLASLVDGDSATATQEDAVLIPLDMRSMVDVRWA